MYVPEIDRAAWFVIPLAREKILASQRPFLDRLEPLCNGESPHDDRKTT
jgi:predicted NUDIX family NTP pyrophosphohydrolase